MWVFLLEGDIINFNKLKRIFKYLTSEKTSASTGNLAYLAVLAIAPTIILTTSFLDTLNEYFNFSNIKSFQRIFELSNFLNLNFTANIFINIICINLLSNGIFFLLSEIENIYRFEFGSNFQKRLYSLALSFILILEMIVVVLTSIFISKLVFFQNIDFIINFTTIFLFIITFYKFSTFQKIKDLLPGSLVSSLLLTIFLTFFYYIIENFSDIKTNYGLLSPVIIFLILIYYSCSIIYLGNAINAVFKDHEY